MSLTRSNSASVQRGIRTGNQEREKIDFSIEMEKQRLASAMKASRDGLDRDQQRSMSRTRTEQAALLKEAKAAAVAKAKADMETEMANQRVASQIKLDREQLEKEQLLDTVRRTPLTGLDLSKLFVTCEQRRRRSSPLIRSVTPRA